MLQFGNLKCRPRSVNEVIENRECDDQYVAIHGILFYGYGSQTNEFLLLPKEGSFDGVGPIPMPELLDRTKCILIEEPDLDNKLGGSSASGSYRYKYDTIVIGKVRRESASSHPVRVGELWLVLMQDWEEMPRGTSFHELRVISFPLSRFPKLPWNDEDIKGKSLIQIGLPFLGEK